MKKLYKLFPYLFITLLLISGCITPHNPQPTAISKGTALSAHVKRADTSEHILFGYPGHEKIILYRRGYALGYNPDKKVADWVSYHFTDAYCVKNTSVNATLSRM